MATQLSSPSFGAAPAELQWWRQHRGGWKIAIQAAKSFRALRKLGVNVRKTINTVIATRCIESGYDLLHDDRYFDSFTKHLGLRIVV
jgi:hypothetical protein